MERRLAGEYRDVLRDFSGRIAVNGRYRGIRGQYSWDCDIFIEENTSAYRNTLIRLSLKFPTEYPFKPPTITFKTPVFHPYIHDMGGRFCTHVLKYFWFFNQRLSLTKNWTVRWTLNFIADIFVDEGSSLKDIKSLCQNNSVADIRDNDYCLFDKIIQKCLGHELEEDPDPNDNFFDRNSVKSWEEQVKDQRALNTIQSHLCAEMFAGRLTEVETMTRCLLGLVEGPKSKEFQTVHILPAVISPKEERTLISTDGTIIKCPKWSTLELIYSLNAGGNIPTILSTNMIQKVLELCHVRESVEIRKYNQMEMFFDESINEKYMSMTPDQTWEVLNAANFLGGHEIVLGCCIRLCKYFVHTSRVQYTVDKLRNISRDS